MPPKKVLEKLPAARFRRIHRGYVVAIDKVQSVVNRKVQLKNGDEIPLSTSHLDFLDEWKKS
ncbi:MAG: LytTR family DNA-binding domain-containing protein [Flavihumibacter sp.]